jgi:hypothetical protein
MKDITRKGIMGHGGIKCNCCRPANMTVAEAKKFSARTIRRRGKAMIKSERNED